MCVCTMFLFSPPIFYTAVQIGFQQDSYTVLETDESVTVCVQMNTGNYTVPVTRAVLSTGSAESMYTILSHTKAVVYAHTSLGL